MDNNTSNEKEIKTLMVHESNKPGLPALYSGKASEYTKPIRARHQKLTADSELWLKQLDMLTLNDTKKIGLFMVHIDGSVIEVDGLLYNPTNYVCKVQFLDGHIQDVRAHLLGDKLDEFGYPKGVGWQRKLSKRFISFLSAVKLESTEWGL